MKIVLMKIGKEHLKDFIKYLQMIFIYKEQIKFHYEKLIHKYIQIEKHSFIQELNLEQQQTSLLLLVIQILDSIGSLIEFFHFILTLLKSRSSDKIEYQQSLLILVIMLRYGKVQNLSTIQLLIKKTTPFISLNNFYLYGY